MKICGIGCSVFGETQKPYFAMLFTQFVYAGMALFSKAAIDFGMSPYVFVVYRQAFATLALAPFTYFLEWKDAPPLTYSLMFKIFLSSLLGLTVSLNLYYIALNYTTATFAAASSSVVPAITFIMAAVLRMESISVKHLYGVAKVIGSVTCVVGAIMVALDKGPAVKFMNWYPSTHTGVSTHPHSNTSLINWVKGTLIMLSANTSWALWLILQGPILKIYPAKMHLTNLQCFFSCIQSAIWALAVDRNAHSWMLGWNVQLVSVAYCGVVVTGITYWLQVWCIGKKGPVFTSMFSPLSLLITAIFSAFLWKEPFHLGSVGGGLLLVVGLYSVLWGKKEEETHCNQSQKPDIEDEEKGKVQSPGVKDEEEKGKVQTPDIEVEEAKVKSPYGTKVETPEIEDKEVALECIRHQ